MTVDELSAKLLTATLKGIASVADDLRIEEQMEVIEFLAHREYGLAAETLLDIANSKDILSEYLDNLAVALDEAKKHIS